jgi:AmmeMemoRadiSam system radical SAM enzyme
VAFTYNDPVMFLEDAIDVADACHDLGINAVAVTAGYICPDPSVEFYRHMDAANVDLKAFKQDFYRHTCGGDVAAVLDTLIYLKHETSVWFEITNLLIPGLNDSNAEIDALTTWVVGHLDSDIPVHFTAFDPDFKTLDRPPTPPANPLPGSTDCRGERHTFRLHRQRSQPGQIEHVLPGLRHPARWARLVCPGRVQAHRHRVLLRLRHPLPWGV